MTVAERLRSPSIDSFSGWIFIAGAVVNMVWLIADAVTVRAVLPTDTLASLERYAPPLWFLVIVQSLTLATLTIIGLGIVRGRAWALWVQGLFSLRTAFEQIVRPWNGRIGIHGAAILGFSFLVFVYTGLRILGWIGDGPRPLFRQVNQES